MNARVDQHPETVGLISEGISVACMHTGLLYCTIASDGPHKASSVRVSKIVTEAALLSCLRKLLETRTLDESKHALYSGRLFAAD